MNNNFTPPTPAGLLFCPAAIQPHTSVYSVFCAVNANYTANDAKRRTGLYSGFSCNYANSTAHNTRQTQAAIIPPAPRWSVSQRRSTSSTYQIPPPRRTLCRSAQPPYYNKVYKGGAVQHTANRACGGVSILPTPGGLRSGTGSAVRAYRLTLSTRRGSQAAGGAAGGAEPLAATAAALFGLPPDSQ